MNDISERISKFESQIINYRAYNLAYVTIMRSIQTTQMRGVPSCVVLIGESGSGKSTLCNQLMATFPEPSVVEHEASATVKRPAIFCGLPTKATIKSFAKSLLGALKCPINSGDAYDLTERVIQQFLIQQVEVAYLDEFQMLADKKAEQARMDVSNCVARLVDRTGIPFVIAGTPEIEELFYSIDLLIRRFPFFAKLPPLELQLSDPNADYQVILRGLDKKIYDIGELKQGVHLHEPNIAVPIYAASSGNLETMRLLLSNAFFSSLSRGDQTLQISDFMDAADITRHDHDFLKEGNPFRKNHLVLAKEIENKKNDLALSVFAVSS